VERKRHIGNDIINIVFVDGGPEEMAREWLDTGLRKPSHMIVNPLPHCGRPFWVYTSLNAKYSKSDKGKVLLKIRYSSSFILCLF
jgi:hypothetical protein